MNISKVSVKRPLTMIMIFCIVIVFGAMGYTKMPVNLMPDMDLPVATIMTVWSGATAEDVEDQVTEVIEDAVSAIGGVDTYISMSGDSISAVMLQFEFGADMTENMNTIRSKVDAVQTQLPDDANKPTVSEVDINAMPVGTIIVTSDTLGNAAVKTFAEDTVQVNLEQLSGVSSVDIKGDITSVINVKVDTNMLSRYGLTLPQVYSALDTANGTTPFGSITQGDEDFSIRTIDELTSVEDVANIQLTTAAGNPVNLSDVATVTYEPSEKEAIYRYNGKDTLMLDINKQQSANTVEIMEKARALVEKLDAASPDYTVKVVSDESEYISSSMDSIWSTLAMSSIIAFLVLLVFLKDFKASFIVALAIPLSIVGTVAGLYFSGQTLNLITVGGLVLGVGMVVDASIVVIENIFRLRAEKPDLSLEEACIEGAATVGGAVLASTLTSVAVFLPMLFTEGVIKMMFGALSLSIIYSLMFSVIVALTVIPALFYLFSKGTRKGVKEKATPLFDKFAGAYEGLLNFCLSHRLLTIFISIALFVSSLPIAATLGMDMMPASDKGVMSVTIDMPDGISLETADYYLTLAEEQLLTIPELETMTSSVGSSGGLSSLSSSTDKATINMTLTPQTERERSTKEISQEVKELLAIVPDCEITVSVDSSTMSATSGGFSLQLSGPDLDVLKVITEDVENHIKTVEGLSDVTNSLVTASQEAQLVIDKRRATELGVSTSTITSILRMSIAGMDEVTTANIDDQTVNINLQLASDRLTSLDDILTLKVFSSTGSEIPVSSFATIKIVDGTSTLTKTDGSYSVTVSAELADGLTSTEAQQRVNEAIKSVVLPQHYTIGQGAQMEMLYESIESLIIAIIMAIALVYMVMVAQFESFKKPFMIIFCIPFGFVGVVWALVAFNSNLSIPAFIGMILLVGIVVNNGIVLIDYIEQLRAEGHMSLRECVAKGSASRLRPVLMTTLTTVLALIPTAFGIGEGSETMAPMGIVTLGGLTVSTFVTLLLIPTIYYLIEARLEKRNAKKLSKQSQKSNASISI